MIAGSFDSKEYFQSIIEQKTDNIKVLNKLLSLEELSAYISQSKYVLFTYNSKSVLSSAALCKTLSFGKAVIGPSIGAFKELRQMKLLYTYDSFFELETLLEELEHGKQEEIDQTLLCNYVRSTSWRAFSFFLSKHLNTLFSGEVYCSAPEAIR
jgi:glycosyltransferase involved in cell wall biosynthesis